MVVNKLESGVGMLEMSCGASGSTSMVPFFWLGVSGWVV